MAAYGSDIDVRELLKRGVFASRAKGCDDHFEKSRACPSSVYGISDVYVVLDSYLASRRDPRRGEFHFRFGVGQQSGTDKIGVRDSIRTLIQINAEEFCTGIPPMGEPGADTSAGQLTLIGNTPATDPRDGNPVTSSASQLAHCPRVTVYFSNLGVQAHSDFRDRYHHFEFAASPSDDGFASANELNGRMILTPVESRYVLTEPHRDLHDLHVRFFSPDAPLELPPAIIDGIQIAAVDVAGVLRLTVVGPAVENDGRTPLDLSDLVVPGDRVYLENVSLEPASFTSAGLAGVISRFLNQEAGHIVGANSNGAPGVTPAATGFVAAPAQSGFELDSTVDLTAIVAAGGDQIIPQAAGSKRIRLYIAKNRIRMPVRFRCIVDRLTNYIAP